MADEHKVAHLTAQMVEASNDVQAAIARLMVVPEETPAGLLVYCVDAVATSRAKYVKARSEWLSRQHGPDAEYRLR